MVSDFAIPALLPDSAEVLTRYLVRINKHCILRSPRPKHLLRVRTPISHLAVKPVKLPGVSNITIGNRAIYGNRPEEFRTWENVDFGASDIMIAEPKIRF